MQPKVLLVDNGSAKLKSLIRIVPGRVDVLSWRDSLDDASTYDLIVLSPTSYLPVFLAQYIVARQIELIKNAEKPVIGICFGLQLIAGAFGARTEFNPIPDISINQTVVNQPNHPIFKGRQSFLARYSHFFHLSESGSELSTLALYNNHYLAMVEHKTKPIIGLQWHPEGNETTREIFCSTINYLLNKTIS